MTCKNLFGIAGLTLALAANLNAAEVIRYEGQPTGSKIRMDGDSSIHRWYAESPLISGSLEFEKGFVLDAVKPGPVPAKVQASIPVRTFMSSGTPQRSMNNVMYDALNAKQFPRIDFRLDTLECKEAAKDKAPAKFQAKGHLAVMGTTNPVTLAVTMEAPDKEKLLVKTVEKVKLKMTDFKVVPPKLNLGIIKITTDDNLEIGFEWMTAVKAEEKK